ncbi:LysR family transcriptional regulator [Xenorhabdus anantnagensis]|uniref:LysR family transcriptional regulator n=1 Tax=Xenorhabdus anantnagensis TaxID=3025875 RepID=A0ABT5LWN1_9GAMM|nr:LysR family transcriptional regulator [Xenorhabdus anantnagensis]MDC9598860.1 LysR family transcriptional regulator [Xenorhabdus anantnagensis]
MNNYKLLPALVSILQTLNLTESSKQLGVTQSAMSKTLHQLREDFHDKIIVREANQFILTKKGEKLKEKLPILMQQLDNLYAPELMEPSLCERKFILASSDYVAQAILPSIFSNIEIDAPNVSIEYKLWHKDSLNKFAEQDVDLVATIADSIPDNLYGKRMAEDQLAVVFRSTHPKTNSDMTINDYIEGRHILISGGGDKDSSVDHALSMMSLNRHISATVPFFQAAIELLLKTDTMLTIPLHIAADFTQNYDLQIRRLPIDIKEQQYYLLWHAKHHQDPEHRWFRDICFPLIKNHLERTIEHGMKLIHTHK